MKKKSFLVLMVVGLFAVLTIISANAAEPLMIQDLENMETDVPADNWHYIAMFPPGVSWANGFGYLDSEGKVWTFIDKNVYSIPKQVEMLLGIGEEANILIPAGKIVTLTYDGGKRLDVYLPEYWTSPSTYYVYPAIDGSTYYDEALTQLAQAAPDSDWTVMYEANELPDVAIPAWIMQGDDSLCSVSGGKTLTVYLPAFPGELLLYVATDGSTYYDEALTQLAQSANAAEPLKIKDLENMHITIARSSIEWGWEFSVGLVGQPTISPLGTIVDNENSFKDGNSAEEPYRVWFMVQSVDESINVHAGDTLEITYDDGQELKIYLPRLVEDVNLFVATDGSTYYDEALTQLAQSANAAEPLKIKDLENMHITTPTSLFAEGWEVLLEDLSSGKLLGLVTDNSNVYEDRPSLNSAEAVGIRFNEVEGDIDNPAGYSVEVTYDGGILTTEGTGVTIVSYYRDDLVSNSVGNMVETRMKYITGTTACQLTLRAEPKTTTLVILSYEIAVDGGGGNYIMDTTDTFHTYRLALKNNVVKVYVDGILRITSTPNVQTGYNRVYFITGDTAEAQWDYVRYYTGVVTPIGTNVTVNLPDGVSMTYDNVTQEGYTNVTISETGPEPPEGFNLKPTEPTKYYDITTTAIYSGNVTVKINYEDAWIEPGEAEEDLKLMHYEAPDWINVTDPGYPDTVNNIIQGTVTTLSPFVLAMPISVPATLRIKPETLNLKSKGKWITCYIELPEGYDVADIDVDTVMLNDAVLAEWGEVQDAMLMVKFDRSEVQAILEPSEEVEITVTGELYDDTPFEGSDTIKVIDKGKK